MASKIAAPARPLAAPRRRAAPVEGGEARRSARVCGERAPGFVDDAYDDDYVEEEGAPRRAWRATGRRAYIPQARPIPWTLRETASALRTCGPARPAPACSARSSLHPSPVRAPSRAEAPRVRRGRTPGTASVSSSCRRCWTSTARRSSATRAATSARSAWPAGAPRIRSDPGVHCTDITLIAGAATSRGRWRAARARASSAAAACSTSTALRQWMRLRRSSRSTRATGGCASRAPARARARRRAAAA